MKVTWFDRARVLAELREAAARLAEEHPEVERVLLFGSVARGDCVPGSDADLLVLLSGDEIAEPRAWIERLGRYRVEGVSCGVDLFPYTGAEVAARIAGGDPFVDEARSGAIELYRREG